MDRPKTEFTLPFSIKLPDPKFSKEARGKRVSGKVVVLMEVMETGRVTGVWLASSMGDGLDLKAAEAVEKYVMKPARYKGQDVGMQMVVELNIEVF